MGLVAGPADNGFAITPNDATPLPTVTRGLYIGVTGNVSVILRGGATLLFVAVPAGALLPIEATHVRASGTTATSIVGVY